MSTSDQVDRRVALRGSSASLLGAMYAGFAGFGLNIIVGRLYGAHLAGVFYQSIAIFMILNCVALLGSETGFFRMAAHYRALDRHGDAWTLTRRVLPALLVSGSAVSMALLLATPFVAERIDPGDTDRASAFLHVLCLTLVVSAGGQAFLAGTRAFGGVRPFVLLYQLWLPTSRAVLVILAVDVPLPDWRMILAWTAPLVAMDAAAVVYVFRRSSAAVRGQSEHALPPVPPRRIVREFWSFSLPRALASLFETVIVWADVLIVGYLLSPALAGVYGIASRFITTGTMAMEATRLATAPMFAAAFARGDRSRTQALYEFSTVWLVLLSWPVFLTMATFAPLLMSVIGDEFEAAVPAITVMSLLVLVYLGFGNVNAIMLMAGRSRTTATITFFSMVLNVGANFVVVPRFGVAGAAVVWGTTLAFDSALCTWQCRNQLGLRMPLRAISLAGGVCLVAFGLPGLLVRTTMGASWSTFAAFVLVSIPVYGLLTWKLRSSLHVEDIWAALGRLKQRGGATR